MDATGYVNDAEKYRWSTVQLDVYRFERVDGANWKIPDGINVPASKDLPVTQVSYNDAAAYSKWAEVKLPSFKQYWELVKDDQRKIYLTPDICCRDQPSFSFLATTKLSNLLQARLHS